MSLNIAHIDWSRKTFAMMRDGGTWGIPRSGLIFTRKGNALVLTARMPHEKAMPLDAEQLARQQLGDYTAVVEHFGAAGIKVRDESGLPTGKDQS